LIDKTTNRYKSQKRENTIAKDFQGQRVIMSGGSWSKPGDVVADCYLFEDKFTESDSYTIKLSTLKKIEKQSIFVRKVPVFVFGYVNVQNKTQSNYIILRDFNTDLDISKSVEQVTYVNTKSKRIKVDDIKEMKNQETPIIRLVFDVEGLLHTYYIFDYDFFKENHSAIVVV
jgi:hypothetical protein